MSGSFRSALICHVNDRLNLDGMSRWLASFSELVLRVEIEEPPSRLLQRIRREIRRSGMLGFADVLAFRALYRIRYARRDQAWTDAVLADLATRFPSTGNPVRLRVSSPNDPEVVRALIAQRVDFGVARCKSLLKPEVFGAVPQGIFVLHPGMCPEYRNAHGGFWALVNREPAKVVTTLLRIDAGVDSGPVYGYFTAGFDELAESHIVIQDRTLFDNLDPVAAILQEVLLGARKPLDTAGRASRVWGQPRLTHFLRWKRAARRARRLR